MQKAAVGLFDDVTQVEQIVAELRQAGVSEGRLAVLVSAEANEVSNLLKDEAAEGATVGAATGGGIGATAGLLGSLALLPVPGLNVAAATSLMASAVGGIGGGFLGALYGSRAKENTELNLKDHLAQGGVMVIAVVNEANEASVMATLERFDGQFVSTHEISATELAAIQEHHAAGENAVPKSDGKREHYNPQED